MEHDTNVAMDLADIASSVPESEEPPLVLVGGAYRYLVNGRVSMPQHEYARLHRDQRTVIDWVPYALASGPALVRVELV
jgi:hypothetical protein